MSNSNEEQRLAALYGPATPYSDHKRGEQIRFRDPESGKAMIGVILWVKAPGPNYAGGPSRPTTYIVDAGTGFPQAIYPSDIIEDEEHS